MDTPQSHDLIIDGYTVATWRIGVNDDLPSVAEVISHRRRYIDTLEYKPKQGSSEVFYERGGKTRSVDRHSEKLVRAETYFTSGGAKYRTAVVVCLPSNNPTAGSSDVARNYVVQALSNFKAG